MHITKQIIHVGWCLTALPAQRCYVIPC